MFYLIVEVKQFLYMSRVFQEIKVTSFQHNPHIKVIRYSALGTDRLYTPEIIPGAHSSEKLSRPQSNSEAERIVSIQNSNCIIGK